MKIKPLLRQIFAVLAGLIIGSLVNMLLVEIGSKIVSPPKGYDLTKMEGLKAAMSVMQPKHFIFPFIAHAFGSLTGAFTASMIATSRKLALSLFIGGFFMIGGMSMIWILPSPTWFNLLDISLAYFPAAYLGHKVAQRIHAKK